MRQDVGGEEHWTKGKQIWRSLGTQVEGYAVTLYITTRHLNTTVIPLHKIKSC